MSQQQEVSRQVKRMCDYLNQVASSTDGPGASKPGSYNFEKRASAHTYMRGEARRIMSEFSRNDWAHEASYLETWANDQGYRG